MKAQALPFLPQAVIFDMDGLMLDSERAITRCLARAATEQGHAIERGYWLRMVGKGDAACRAMLAERIGAEASQCRPGIATRPSHTSSRETPRNSP